MESQQPRNKFNLSKGDRFNLSKAAPGLSKVKVGLGWNPNETPNGPDFDLDVSAFGLGRDYKIISDSYFVFYNQIQMGNWAYDEKEPEYKRPITQGKDIVGAIDDPDGSRSDGDDDEDMYIYLDKVDERVEQIIICASICKYPNDRKGDRRTADLFFGQVDDCYIRIVNEVTDMEILRYDLGKGSEFSKADAIEFGRLYRVGNNWEFEAMGRPHKGSLGVLAELYT